MRLTAIAAGLALPLLLAWTSPSVALTATDEAARAGLPTAPMMTQGTMPLLDMNRDGRIDVLLDEHNQGPLLPRCMRGDGTFFACLQTQWGRNDRHACTVGNFGAPGQRPRDNLPDLFCTLGSCSGNPAGCGRTFPRELWLGRPGGGFVNEGAAWGLASVDDRGRDAKAFDADGDGDDDIVVASENSPTGRSRNRFYVNRGTSFAEPANSAVNRSLGSTCVATFRRRDGRRDLLFCARPERNGGNGVATYRWNSGRFVAATTQTPYASERPRHIVFGDLNGDGRDDMVLVNPTNLEVWLNEGDRFPRRSFSAPIRQGFNAAICRADGNASNDIFVVGGKLGLSAGQAPDLLLRNSGTGRSFTAFTNFPQQTAIGGGANVRCLQNWQGRANYAAFVVANGFGIHKGRYQLIAFRR